MLDSYNRYFWGMLPSAAPGPDPLSPAPELAQQQGQGLVRKKCKHIHGHTKPVPVAVPLPAWVPQFRLPWTWPHLDIHCEIATILMPSCHVTTLKNGVSVAVAVRQPSV